MDENVKKILNEQLWNVATYSDEPNVVPVGFKKVTDDGKLAMADVFMETTVANIKANGKAAISACDAVTFEGYQVKGSAEYLTEGPVVDEFKKLVEELFKGAATAKGAVVVTPEKIIITTPGPDNKRVL